MASRLFARRDHLVYNYVDVIAVYFSLFIKVAVPMCFATLLYIKSWFNRLSTKYILLRFILTIIGQFNWNNYV